MVRGPPIHPVSVRSWLDSVLLESLLQPVRNLEELNEEKSRERRGETRAYLCDLRSVLIDYHIREA